MENNMISVCILEESYPDMDKDLSFIQIPNGLQPPVGKKFRNIPEDIFLEWEDTIRRWGKMQQQMKEVRDSRKIAQL